MNMTLAQKQALQALVEAGAEVATVAYDPENVVGDPEGDAVAAGWVEFQREDHANLVEVVYTR
jgi:hypothetical protein